MTLRGALAHGSKTVTSALLGTLGYGTRGHEPSSSRFVGAYPADHSLRRDRQTMAAYEALVIAGAGLGQALRAAETLRGEGSSTAWSSSSVPRTNGYERPPLSKDYLTGKAERGSIYVHQQDWYREHDVDLRLGAAVTGIDRERHEVTLADGSRIGYAKLLLTTGSSPRRLQVPGSGLLGVHYLRTVADSDQLRQAFQGAERVAVIGAGWIGLEAAAAARTAGAEVAIVEMAELPLLRVLGREVAEVFAALHRANGVDLRMSAGVAELTGTGERVSGVRLSDGSLIEADAVVVGIGITPNTQFAEAARLEVSNGIVTDASLRTSDPDIYAAGDVACAYHPLLKSSIRVEHWANARHQPVTAAKAMLGQEAVYDRLPCATPTSTTSAWSTPATWSQTATTRWCSEATRSCASSSRSGSARAGCWPA